MMQLKALLPATSKVLEDLSQYNWLADFTLVGGSGLSLHIAHRLSEDLDFFTWEKTLKKEEIFASLALFEKYQLLSVSDTQIDCLLDNVKVTFFANNWEILKERENLMQNVFVAKTTLLTSMKINTLFLRAKYRDYYDLYCINKDLFNIKEMFDFAEENIKGITKKLFYMAIIFTDDILEDEINYLKPKYKISKTQIAKHFEKELKRYKF